ncbi:hypothetical protein GQ600_3236 [Phytophthora cactorum]|nr:hypothetical protein GQ600_3236 [Phytophthora cactorum]
MLHYTRGLLHVSYVTSQISSEGWSKNRQNLQSSRSLAELTNSIWTTCIRQVDEFVSAVHVDRINISPMVSVTTPIKWPHNVLARYRVARKKFAGVQAAIAFPRYADADATQYPVNVTKWRQIMMVSGMCPIFLLLAVFGVGDPHGAENADPLLFRAQEPKLEALPGLCCD